MGKKKLLIATADCETDPFEFNMVPMPFVWGFYSEAEGYCHFWGEGESREEQRESCIRRFIDFLNGLAQPHCIYMHNGGKFDLIFLLSELSGSLKIVNGRILECRIDHHVVRDSYAAVPIPLAAYKKDDIDYQKLSHGVRQKNRSEIVHYLGGDVRYLFEMMTEYRAEFGDVLTIGTAAMRALRKYHAFAEFDSEQDAFFRRFYYGGRNQCFDSGILKGDWKVYDVNSMYPFCMQSMLHPGSSTFSESRSLDANTDFIIVRGWNRGALPFKDDKLHHLDFTKEYGVFHTTGHELRAGLETGTFEIDEIESAYSFSQRMCFSDFVDAYYAKRMVAKDNGLELYVLFYKLILNSAYGKFCLNSDNFKDWQITGADEFLDIDLWTPEVQTNEYILWSKPTSQAKFYNVATGASITGGARSQLLRGLSLSERPVYCDTDSIICTGLSASSNDKRLGAWKLEAEGDEICIAGKKLYALYRNGNVVRNDKGVPKQASKGARLSASEIRAIAEGGMVSFKNPVPAFKVDGNHQFIERRIRKTAWDVKPFGI